VGSKFKSVFTKEYQLFLARFRTARLAAGLTQETLAQRLGEYQIFVSRCERGERRMDVIELRAFCRAMDVPFVEFVTELDAELEQLEAQPQSSRSKVLNRRSEP
jgi:transcriptional regulator with XRE-family HTH domain